MHFLKLLIPTLLILLLSGCMSGQYYVLSNASTPSKTYAYKSERIGVEKVTVPEYLFKRELAVAKSSSQIVFLSDGTWAEDLNAGLTQRLISFLQKKFNQPHVYAYPWGIDKQPSKKVKVTISRFIAQGKRVYLDANWEVENLRTGRSKARLFSTTVATSSSAKSIVSSMDKAFGELEEVVAQGVR